MRQLPRTGFPLPAAALAGVVAAALPGAGAAPAARPFPMTSVGARRLVLDAERFEALRGLDAVLLEGVPVGSRRARMRLRRMRIAREGSVLALDGRRLDLAEFARDLLLFRGAVDGEPDSHAFLAFSPFGCRGLVQTSEGLFAFGGRPGTDPLSARAFAPVGRPSTAAACLAAEIDQPFALGAEELAAPASGFAPSGTPVVYEAHVAVETDYAFFSLFGDAAQAATYALTLFAAASDIYLQEVQVVLDVPYLGIHSLPNDGWQSPDNGGDALDLLLEFRNRWKNGKAPVAADLHHFLSGADLGGGIAYLNVLCSPGFSFSVSGDIDGGLTQPVGDPTPWDLLVVCHELGHNFVTPHTHDYCPPLDQCAPHPFFGTCQKKHLCIPNGTIMSYCHLCPGGLSNVDLTFHPTAAVAIRAQVEQSCLQPVSLEHDLCVDEPAGFHLVVDPAADPPQALSLSVADCGTSSDPISVSVSLEPPAPWLAVSPASGTVAADPLQLSLQASAAGLDFGLHQTSIVLNDDSLVGDTEEVPFSLLVLPPPFLSKDELVGELTPGEGDDQARIDLVKGTKLKLTVDAGAAQAPLHVALLDDNDLPWALWTVPPGKAKHIDKKVPKDGVFRVRVEGLGSYAIQTKAKWPPKAKPKNVKKKPKKGSDFVDLDFRAVAGTLLDAAAAPKPADLATASLQLYAPDGEAVDLGGALGPSGLSIASLSLGGTGLYKLRVSGVHAAVKIHLVPQPPVGGAKVPVD